MLTVIKLLFFDKLSLAVIAPPAASKPTACYVPALLATGAFLEGSQQNETLLEPLQHLTARWGRCCGTVDCSFGITWQS